MKVPKIIVCASGKSSRFGSSKLLHKLPDGRRLLESVLTNITLGTQQNCAVIIPPDNKIIHQLVEDLGCEAVPTDVVSNGIGETIAFGVKKYSKENGWMICLGDMPFIPPEIYSKVYSLAISNKIVVPCCGGKKGHPVLFPRNYYEPLSTLKGDRGGAKILKNNAHDVLSLNTDDKSINFDVDEPQDLGIGNYRFRNL